MYVMNYGNLNNIAETVIIYSLCANNILSIFGGNDER